MAHWIEKRAKMRKRRRNDTVPMEYKGKIVMMSVYSLP
jgi:hypothetical protein